MRYKVWYEIYGEGQIEGVVLLAKVKSKGNAFIVAETLAKSGYKNVIIK